MYYFKTIASVHKLPLTSVIYLKFITCLKGLVTKFGILMDCFFFNLFILYLKATSVVTVAGFLYRLDCVY